MIKLIKTMRFSESELARLYQVVTLANEVLASPSFKQAVESIQSFVDSSDNGEQVFKKLTDGEHGLTVGLYSPPWYKRWSSAIARENWDGSIEFRRSYFESADLSDLAGTLVHELAHRVGYHHSFWPNSTRDQSVPYAVGHIADSVGHSLVTAVSKVE